MFVRFANENDIPQMLDLLLQVGAVHHDIRPDLFREGAQKYDETALKRLLTDPNCPILAADEDGKMVGYAFCILQVTKDDPALCDRRVLYVDDLCVDEKHRGQGIATALYERALALAREMKCAALTLNVWWGNNNALRFYEKCGLKRQKIGMETVL